MNDDSEALSKFGHEVIKLCDLYVQAQQSLQRHVLREFNVQFHLVYALAQVAVLPVHRDPPQASEGGAK